MILFSAEVDFLPEKRFEFYVGIRLTEHAEKHHDQNSFFDRIMYAQTIACVWSHWVYINFRVYMWYVMYLHLIDGCNC